MIRLVCVEGKPFYEISAKIVRRNWRTVHGWSEGLK